MQKVFIADASFIIRERLVTMLRKLAEIEVVGQTENIGEATNAIQKLQPDVVILDIGMPGDSGTSVLQTLKQAEARLIIIILTNHPYQGYQQKCLQAGADFFLDKSIEFDQIPSLLERFAMGNDNLVVG